MIDLLHTMFSTPEAQADAYAWAAVFLAHAMIGAVLAAILTAVLGVRARLAAGAVSVLYGIIWEGGQFLRAGGGFWDGMLDWTAVTLGAALIAAIWERRRGLIVGIGAAAVLILSTGIRRRK